MKARLSLKVRAGAARTKFTGAYGEAWKLQVAAPPVDGKANEAIITFLARLTLLPARAIRIVSGATASLKLIELDGISSEALGRVILEANESRTNPGIVTPSES